MMNLECRVFWESKKKLQKNERGVTPTPPATEMGDKEGWMREAPTVMLKSARYSVFGRKGFKFVWPPIRNDFLETIYKLSPFFIQYFVVFFPGASRSNETKSDLSYPRIQRASLRQASPLPHLRSCKTQLEGVSQSFGMMAGAGAVLARWNNRHMIGGGLKGLEGGRQKAFEGQISLNKVRVACERSQ